MKPKMYLAGPIKGLYYDEAVDWRDAVTAHLADVVECISPMRAKANLKNVGRLDANQQQEEDVMCTSKGITVRDRYDVQRSDLILMNLRDAEDFSIGTTIELGWADAWRKPVILVIRENSEYGKHPMVKECVSFIVYSLEDALDIVRRLI